MTDLAKRRDGDGCAHVPINSSHTSHWHVFKLTARWAGAFRSWAAVAALLARCVQGLYAYGNEDEGRLQLYVDDPLLAVRGNGWRRRRLVVRFCVAFLVLGFRLACNKAQYAPTVGWIGICLRVILRRVEAIIPEDNVQDILALVNDMLTVNVVAEKKVRTLAGKSMNVALLIVVLRPFLASFWASLSHSVPRAPRGCICVKRLVWALLWLQKLLSHTKGLHSQVF